MTATLLDGKGFPFISCWNIRRTKLNSMGLDHPLNGITNPKYKLLHFLTTNFFCREKKSLAFNWDRCCHLVLCLQLILFHSRGWQWLHPFFVGGEDIFYTRKRNFGGDLPPSIHTVENLLRTPWPGKSVGRMIWALAPITNFYVLANIFLIGA